jgi:hypothetical protein
MMMLGFPLKTIKLNRYQAKRILALSAAISSYS